MLLFHYDKMNNEDLGNDIHEISLSLQDIYHELENIDKSLRKEGITYIDSWDYE